MVEYRDILTKIFVLQISLILADPLLIFAVAPPIEVSNRLLDGLMQYPNTIAFYQLGNVVPSPLAFEGLTAVVHALITSQNNDNRRQGMFIDLINHIKTAVFSLHPHIRHDHIKMMLA